LAFAKAFEMDPNQDTGAIGWVSTHQGRLYARFDENPLQPLDLNPENMWMERLRGLKSPSVPVLEIHRRFLEAKFTGNRAAESAARKALREVSRSPNKEVRDLALRLLAWSGGVNSKLHKAGADGK
jgi:hypothetical protein